MADEPTQKTQASLNKKAATKTAYKPSGVSATGRNARSFAIRLWSVRHSRELEWFSAASPSFFLMRESDVEGDFGLPSAEAPVVSSRSTSRASFSTDRNVRPIA